MKTIDLTDATLLTQGAHTTTLDLSEVSDGTYSWTMTATGATTESAPVQVNDTDQPQFQFYHPRDVIVDNSTKALILDAYMLQCAGLQDQMVLHRMCKHRQRYLYS